MTRVGESNFTWTRCVNWQRGSQHGGLMAPSNWKGVTSEGMFPAVISIQSIRQIFGNVSSLIRENGDTSDDIYRKVYFTNSNIVDYVSPHIYFERVIEGKDVSTLALNDEIEMSLGGSVSQAGVSGSLTGTSNVSGTSVVGTGTKFLTEVAPGEVIYPAGSDLNINLAQTIRSIEDDTHLTLVDGMTPYDSTGLLVAPIRMCTFRKPFDMASALLNRTLKPGECGALWLKRIITPHISTGFLNDTCKVKIICPV